MANLNQLKINFNPGLQDYNFLVFEFVMWKTPDPKETRRAKFLQNTAIEMNIEDETNTQIYTEPRYLSKLD